MSFLTGFVLNTELSMIGLGIVIKDVMDDHHPLYLHNKDCVGL